MLLVWVPHVFFTIKLDIDGKGDAQRVLLSSLTVAACGLTAADFLALHFSGGPLHSLALGPLIAAITGTVLLVAAPYRALARACWQRGIDGVFHPKELRKHWRNTITELRDALGEAGSSIEKSTPEAMVLQGPNSSANS